MKTNWKYIVAAILLPGGLILLVWYLIRSKSAGSTAQPTVIGSGGGSSIPGSGGSGGGFSLGSLFGGTSGGGFAGTGTSLGDLLKLPGALSNLFGSAYKGVASLFGGTSTIGSPSPLSELNPANINSFAGINEQSSIPDFGFNIPTSDYASLPSSSILNPDNPDTGIYNALGVDFNANPVTYGETYSPTVSSFSDNQSGGSGVVDTSSTDFSSYDISSFNSDYSGD